MPNYRRRYNRKTNKRTYNRRYKKRTYNTRKRRYGNKASKRKMGLTTGIPDRYLMKMKYSTSITMEDTTGGLTAWYTFRGNSIYDPDYSSVGGQPLGRDQWANFYNYYRVGGSKIKCQILNLNTTTATSTIIVTVNPTLLEMGGTIGATALPEYPYCRYALLPAASGGNLPKVINNYISTKKVFGVPTIMDDNFRSGMGGNPTNQWFWNIQATNIAATSETFSCLMLVTITYYVDLHERATLSIS